MKHIIKFSLTLLSVSVLAACGGGSGKGDNEVAQHLNNANSSNAVLKEQLQKAKNANESAYKGYEDTKAASEQATSQTKLAVTAFSSLSTPDSYIMEKFNKSRQELSDTAEAAKTAAEKAFDIAETKLAEVKEQVRIAQENVDFAQIQVQKAQQAATDAARVAEELIKDNTSSSPQNLTPQQQELLNLSRGKTNEEIKKKAADAQRIASEMAASLAQAQLELGKAELSRQYAQQHRDTAKKTLTELKSINFVNPLDIDENEQAIKDSKTLRIGTHKISLADENFGYVTKELGDKQLKVYNLGYSGVGYVLSKNVQIDEYGQLVNNVIEQHNIGENSALPTTKQVFTYHGQSFGAKTDGVLTLKADFEHKTVEGMVTERRLIDTKKSLSDITLQQTAIKSGDYHFEGIAKYQTNEAVQGKYNGNFKGSEAQEVVGYIFDGKDHFYEGFAGKAEVNESILGNKKP
ncbi:factor H binding protein domain-containing protein [Frederiksenia canicola]